MRSIAAAALPLLAKPLFGRLGINWFVATLFPDCCHSPSMIYRACTLLGGISVLLAGVPFLFYAYGKKYVISSIFVLHVN